MLKVLPSKSIPVINAGHEEYTSKNARPRCAAPGLSDVLPLGAVSQVLGCGQSRYLLQE